VQDQKDQHGDPEQHGRRHGDTPDQESEHPDPLYMLALWNSGKALTVKASPFSDDVPTNRPLEL